MGIRVSMPSSRDTFRCMAQRREGGCAGRHLLGVACRCVGRDEAPVPVEHVGAGGVIEDRYLGRPRNVGEPWSRSADTEAPVVHASAAKFQTNAGETGGTEERLLEPLSTAAEDGVIPKIRDLGTFEFDPFQAAPLRVSVPCPRTV